MLSNVLSNLLPAAPRSPVQSRAGQMRMTSAQVMAECGMSPFGSPCSSTCISEEEQRKRSEVLGFCGALIKRYGNTMRAFCVMKQASQAALHSGSQQKATVPSGLEPLSKPEFEWCVTCLLHHGNRRLASRLFAALDAGDAEVSSSSLRASLGWVEDLNSVSKLRQQLLERFGSFEKVEELVRMELLNDCVSPSQASRKSLDRSVSRREFLKVLEALGVDACEAVHLFLILDSAADASINMSHCLQVLDELPPRYAWRDLRLRLLARGWTLADALKCLEANGDQSSERRCVWNSDIPILDGEQGPSHNFESSLRSAACSITLHDFWQRIAAEWPDVRDAARSLSKEKATGLQRLDALLSELLSPELLSRTRRVSTPEPMETPILSCFNFEMFDSLAAHVDVSQQNSRELFQCLAQAGIEAQTSGEGTGKDDVSGSVFLEDFAEQLTLWTEAPEPRGPKRARVLEKVRQAVAPAKAAITALKAELLPSCGKSGEYDQATDASEELPPSTETKPRKLPKLPWCTHYRCRPVLP